MKQRFVFDSFYRVLGVALCLGTAATILVGLLGQFEPTKKSPAWWQEVYSAVSFQGWVTANRAWLMTAFGVTTGAAVGGRKLIGPPWYWDAIREILNTFQQEVFNSLPQSAVSEHHRVTLYRFRAWSFWPAWSRPWGKKCWPWTGWLIPQLRAGPRAPSRTVFRCDDVNTSEGVAGMAYFSQNRVIHVDELPEIKSLTDTEEMEGYAAATNVKPDWMKSRVSENRPIARCYHAVKIEIGGAIWMLMIDTTEPKLPKPQITQSKFEQLEAVLRVLLRRA